MKVPLSKIFFVTCRKNVSQNEDKRDPYEPADFETAISATGFGKFNYILLAVAFAASLSSSFATTSISYILPVAECDLSLTLVDKGMLNACTYLGMICSAILWGFLADTIGRRNLQIWGYWADTLCNIGCALSQSFWLLLIFKFFSGFIVTGPYSILMSYLSEFHSNEYRSRVIILAGVFLSAGNAILPFVAWGVIPLDINYSFFDGTFQITSWRIFLGYCALPSLVAAIGHTFLPESPKFLMTTGQNDKALEVFEKVYQMNTSQPRNTFQIKVLIQENENIVTEKLPNGSIPKKSHMKGFCEGLNQMKAMFFKPHLLNFILVNAIQLFGMMGVNTLRLWLPQLFTTIDEYNQANNYSGDADLCDMIASTSKNVTDNIALSECTVAQVDNQVYINSIIVATCSVVGFFFVSTLINAIGKKNLLIITFTISGLTGISNYWSRSSVTTLSLSSAFITLAIICNQVTVGVIVELFPTTLRTMVISLSMMFGRIGAIMGNMLFPVLLETGCLPPFLMVGGVTAACALFCLFLPSKVEEFK